MNKSVNYSLDMLASEDNARSGIAKILNQYAQRIKPRSKVLELGVGNGRNLLHFREAGHEIFGVDGLAEAVDHCRQQEIPCSLMNLNDDADTLTGKWDLILIIDVLEHLEDPLGLLLKAREHLFEGGRILINLPNHFSAQGRVRILLGSGIDSEGFFPNHPVWSYPHLRFFKHSDACELAAAAGLRIISDFSRQQSRVPHLLGLGRWLGAVYKRLPVDLACGGFFLELSE